jgi:HAD superfamily hydrolase (TIGR01450 family)
MRPVHAYLRGSARPLTELYDVALLDLDGVVYLGPEPIAGVPEALAAARAAGMRLTFVTNNAARPPHVVADHLTELGIAAKSGEVVTSAQAAARHLADRLPGGARVLVVGADGLEQALLERGLVPVADARGQVDAVVQGFSPELNWHLLAEGSIGINRGVPWVATNLDPTVPSTRGRLPGNGSLVAALRHATGKEPVVTGKPDPAMHRESVLRSGAQRPIVVGDRLDTDIEGASAVGCPSLLVLSGVTAPVDLLTAEPRQRPDYLAADVGGLLSAHPEVTRDDSAAQCGSWRATHRGADGVVTLDVLNGNDVALAAGSGWGEVELDALRALCAAVWDAGAPNGELRLTGQSEAARGVLDRLGFA